MIIQDYNKTIAMLVHLIVMNNAFGVAKALKDEGYDTKRFIPAPELEAALLQLNMVNRDKFLKVIQNIPWNPGHINTNQAAIINSMVALTKSKVGASVDNTNWWPSLIKFIEQSRISLR